MVPNNLEASQNGSTLNHPNLAISYHFSSETHGFVDPHFKKHPEERILEPGTPGKVLALGVKALSWPAQPWLPKRNKDWIYSSNRKSPVEVTFSDESSSPWCFPVETIDLPGSVLENVCCFKQLQHIARGPRVGWKIFKTCGCSSGSSVSLHMMFTYSSHGCRGSIPRYAGWISRCRKHGPKMTF